MSEPMLGGVRYRVVHETLYSYQSPVSLSQQYLHLTPRSFAYQQVESSLVWVEPAAEHEEGGEDYFGNLTRHVTLTEPHKVLRVQAESSVILSPRPGLGQIKGGPGWESLAQMLQQLRSPATLDAARYLYDSPHIRCSSALADYARSCFSPGRPHLQAALALTQRIFDEFEFDDSATDISTPLEEVLKGEDKEAIEAKNGYFTDSLTKKVNYLVICNKGNPHWAHMSYGRKFEQALKWQKEGERIRILTEDDFVKVLEG